MNKLLTILTVTAVLTAGTLALRSFGPSHPTSNKELAKVTAMITNMQGNSGGTGVVLRSTRSTSFVMTNAHVCNVAKSGGIVSTNQGTGLVTSYKVSKLHDICLIETNVDLKANTEVAEQAPEEMQDATVSGHPGLAPVIITKGNFSSKEIIQVMTGFRTCSKEEIEKDPILCAFLGGIPVIKSYRAQVTAALISPGSSGSAVWNDSGYISGLVFAGQGNLNISHIVPIEYVKNFVDNEVNTLESQYPNQDSGTSEEQESHKKLREACTDRNSLNYQFVKDFCQYINTDLIYYE